MQIARRIAGHVGAHARHPQRIVADASRCFEVAKWVGRGQAQRADRYHPRIDGEPIPPLVGPLLDAKAKHVARADQRRAELKRPTLDRPQPVVLAHAFVETERQQHVQEASGRLVGSQHPALEHLDLAGPVVLDLEPGQRQWLGVDDFHRHVGLVAGKQARFGQPAPVTHFGQRIAVPERARGPPPAPAALRARRAAGCAGGCRRSARPPRGY